MNNLFILATGILCVNLQKLQSLKRLVDQYVWHCVCLNFNRNISNVKEIINFIWKLQFETCAVWRFIYFLEDIAICYFTYTTNLIDCYYEQVVFQDLTSVNWKGGILEKPKILMNSHKNVVKEKLAILVSNAL